MLTSKEMQISILLIVISTAPRLVLAADAVANSPTGGVFKMVIGLTVVLLVMAFIAWLLRRVLPGIGNRQSVIRVVGGVSVGSRERVVVLEVAGRWLVVGVASGHVSSLANLESGTAQLTDAIVNDEKMPSMGIEGINNHFASWLTKSSAKILDKKQKIID